MASSETVNGVDLRHHLVRANGILQHYVVAGSGDPVVLLHGFAQTWRMWRRDVILALARDYTVIAPDMRGVGDTERPIDGYEKRSMAEDLHALLPSWAISASVRCCWPDTTSALLSPTRTPQPIAMPSASSRSWR